MTFGENYTMLEKLGAGHYAEVYKCEKKATKKHFAVKIIDKSKTTTKQVGDMLGEVAILKELNHKSVLQLEEFIDEGTKVYIVLELIEGGELFQKIVKEKHFSEKRAALYVNQLLQGVAYLHSKGIIHRDLKPENMLLSSKDDDAFLKVVDFGFAEKCGLESTLTKCCGTPLYIAPEVLNAGLFKTGVKYGIQADMWSVGIIAYILLCGYPPFRAKTQSDQFKRIVEGKYEFPDNKGWSSISPEAKDFVSKLLEMSPSSRLTAKAALDHSWMSTIVDDHLGTAVSNIAEFSAATMWKKGIFGVEAVNRILYIQRCTGMKIKPNTAVERLLTEATDLVTEIDLTKNYVGPRGLMAVLDVVDGNPNIKSIIFGNNGANNAVIEKLCVVARAHPALTTIDLSENPISHIAGRMILHMLQGNSRIVKMNLAGTVLQPAMLARIALQLHRNANASEKNTNPDVPQRSLKSKEVQPK